MVCGYDTNVHRKIRSNLGSCDVRVILFVVFGMLNLFLLLHQHKAQVYPLTVNVLYTIPTKLKIH